MEKWEELKLKTIGFVCIIRMDASTLKCLEYVVKEDDNEIESYSRSGCRTK